MEAGVEGGLPFTNYFLFLVIIDEPLHTSERPVGVDTQADELQPTVVCVDGNIVRQRPQVRYVLRTVGPIDWTFVTSLARHDGQDAGVFLRVEHVVAVIVTAEPCHELPPSVDESLQDVADVIHTTFSISIINPSV